MQTPSLLKDDSLDAVMALIERATKRLDAIGIPQWDEIYPNRDVLAADIAARTLYGLSVDGTLAGIVVLNEYQDAEYGEVQWELADPRPLVIHRLCVDPDFQGKGFAKALMAFAENFARDKGHRSIRLDAFTLNPLSLGLYRALRFSERGTVRFRKGRFYCFEKILAR
ncbi:MAG TPA: GNAT family N-acetyltransferase [Treponemataceae bacterium]|nr:GNAT family N-acetyltransferase [Treponemataceae bacterium]HPS44475.1 GNAT family N-acetyltransferase [Treponemataceae bacterium]